MMEGIILIFKIMMVNIVLSGDNAVVIAMASKNLPEHKRIQAVWWGAFGAVALRIVLTVAAVVLLSVPFLQLLGSLLLMYIAVKLLTDEESGDRVKSAATLGSAVWTIIVADFVMSLDNVLAIAAISDGDWVLLIIGIIISIPLIIWGSTFVMKLLDKYPVFIYIGAGVLGYTAGEMLLKDEMVARWLVDAPVPFDAVIPCAAAIIVLSAGWCKRMLRRKA